MRIPLRLKALGALLAVAILLTHPIRLDNEQRTLERQAVASRGDVDRNTQTTESLPFHYETYEVTAYTADYESTRKQPSDPLYGITASGEVVKEGHTIAAPRNIPFGTKIYIPYFDTIFTVEDRGGAIRGNRLDVYMASRDEARAFGRRSLDVLILD